MIAVAVVGVACWAATSVAAIVAAVISVGPTVGGWSAARRSRGRLEVVFLGALIGHLIAALAIATVAMIGVACHVRHGTMKESLEAFGIVGFGVLVCGIPVTAIISASISAGYSWAWPARPEGPSE